MPVYELSRIPLGKTYLELFYEIESKWSQMFGNLDEVFINGVTLSQDNDGLYLKCSVSQWHHVDVYYTKPKKDVYLKFVNIEDSFKFAGIEAFLNVNGERKITREESIYVYKAFVKFYKILNDINGVRSKEIFYYPVK